MMTRTFSPRYVYTVWWARRFALALRFRGRVVWAFSTLAFVTYFKEQGKQENNFPRHLL